MLLPLLPPSSQPQPWRRDPFAREPYTLDGFVSAIAGCGFDSLAQYRVRDFGRRCATVGRPDACFELSFSPGPDGEPVSALLDEGQAWYEAGGRRVEAMHGIGCRAYPLGVGTGPQNYMIVSDAQGDKSDANQVRSDVELGCLMLWARGRPHDEVRDLINGRMHKHDWADIQRENILPGTTHGRVRRYIIELLGKPGVQAVMVRIGERAFILDDYKREAEVDGYGNATYLIHLYHPRSGDVHTIRDHAGLWMGDGTWPRVRPIEDFACYLSGSTVDLPVILHYIDAAPLL